MWKDMEESQHGNVSFGSEQQFGRENLDNTYEETITHKEAKGHQIRLHPDNSDCRPPPRKGRGLDKTLSTSKPLRCICEQQLT
jgi:hypothetical protein